MYAIKIAAGKVLLKAVLTDGQTSNDLISKAQANRDKPVYKYIHLMSPNRLLVVMPDCGFAGGILAYNRQNIRKPTLHNSETIPLGLNLPNHCKSWFSAPLPSKTYHYQINHHYLITF